MRRLTAFLAIISLTQSVVLRAGVLCGGGTAGTAAMATGTAMADMPGMAESAPDTNAPPHPDDQSHHDAADCPLMVGCAAMAVSTVAVAAAAVHSPQAVQPAVPAAVPHFAKAAPEPPPPKS